MSRIEPGENAKKAQSTIILIVLVLIVFGGLAVFLITFAQTIKQPEYTRLYATNIMLSVMRTDTGYTDSRCKQISDVVSCAFFESDWRCKNETTSPTCLDLANNTIRGQIESFELIQKNYRYLFVVKPIRTDPVSGDLVDIMNPRTGEPLRLKLGDLSLEHEKVNKIVESYSIDKMTSQGPIRLKAQIYLSQKEE